MRTDLLILLTVLCATGCAKSGSSEHTGETNSDIIGGNLDSDDPSVVALVVSGSDDKTFGLCTGTVITPRFVLTASHCMSKAILGYEPESSSIIAGPSLKSADATTLAVKRLIPHPEYNPKNGKNDIALVELEEETTLTPIPFSHDAIDNLDGTSVRAVGFGQSVDGDAASSDDKKTANFTLTGIQADSYTLTSDEATQCHGDSGGPTLASSSDGGEIIVGVAWRTVSDDGKCNLGVMSHRVDVYASWIDSVIGK